MTISVEQTRKIASTANAVLTAAVVIAGLVLARDAVQIAGHGSSGVDEAQEAREPAKEYSRTLQFSKYAPVVEDNVFGIKAGNTGGALQKSGGITGSHLPVHQLRVCGKSNPTWPCFGKPVAWR